MVEAALDVFYVGDSYRQGFAEQVKTAGRPTDATEVLRAWRGLVRGATRNPSFLVCVPPLPCSAYSVSASHFPLPRLRAPLLCCIARLPPLHIEPVCCYGRVQGEKRRRGERDRRGEAPYRARPATDRRLRAC